MVYSVCTQLPDGRRVLGNNRPTLKAAESLAMFRASQLPANAAAIIIGHTFETVSTYPGQLPISVDCRPKSKPKPKSKRRRK
jgi:hypothetical protein